MELQGQKKALNTIARAQSDFAVIYSKIQDELSQIETDAWCLNERHLLRSLNALERAGHDHKVFVEDATTPQSTPVASSPDEQQKETMTEEVQERLRKIEQIVAAKDPLKRLQTDRRVADPGPKVIQVSGGATQTILVPKPLTTFRKGKNCYEVLGVSRNATFDTIYDTFKQKMQPIPQELIADRSNELEKKVQQNSEIIQAAQILSSPSLREQHDFEIAAASVPAPSKANPLRNRPPVGATEDPWMPPLKSPPAVSPQGKTDSGTQTPKDVVDTQPPLKAPPPVKGLQDLFPKHYKQGQLHSSLGKEVYIFEKLEDRLQTQEKLIKQRQEEGRITEEDANAALYKIRVQAGASRDLYIHGKEGVTSTSSLPFGQTSSSSSEPSPVLAGPKPPAVPPTAEQMMHSTKQIVSPPFGGPPPALSQELRDQMKALEQNVQKQVRQNVETFHEGVLRDTSPEMSAMALIASKCWTTARMMFAEL